MKTKFILFALGVMLGGLLTFAWAFLEVRKPVDGLGDKRMVMSNDVMYHILYSMEIENGYSPFHDFSMVSDKTICRTICLIKSPEERATRVADVFDAELNRFLDNRSDVRYIKHDSMFSTSPLRWVIPFEGRHTVGTIHFYWMGSDGVVDVLVVISESLKSQIQIARD